METLTTETNTIKLMNTEDVNETGGVQSPLDESACYALFAGHCYYPRGGSDDFRGFGTIEGLKKLYAENADKWSADVGGCRDPWGHIAERETMKTVLCARVDGKWQKPEDVF